MRVTVSPCAYPRLIELFPFDIRLEHKAEISLNHHRLRPSLYFVLAYLTEAEFSLPESALRFGAQRSAHLMHFASRVSTT